MGGNQGVIFLPPIISNPLKAIGKTRSCLRWLSRIENCDAALILVLGTATQIEIMSSYCCLQTIPPFAPRVCPLIQAPSGPTRMRRRRRCLPDARPFQKAQMWSSPAAALLRESRSQPARPRPGFPGRHFRRQRRVRRAARALCSQRRSAPTRGP